MHFRLCLVGVKIDEKIVSGFVKRMQLPNAKMAFMSTLLGLSNSQGNH